MEKATEKNITLLQEKKLEAKDLAEALNKLSEDDKLKIFYMIKGIELVNEQKQSA